MRLESPLPVHACLKASPLVSTHGAVFHIRDNRLLSMSGAGAGRLDGTTNFEVEDRSDAIGLVAGGELESSVDIILERIKRIHDEEVSLRRVFRASSSNSMV